MLIDPCVHFITCEIFQLRVVLARTLNARENEQRLLRDTQTYLAWPWGCLWSVTVCLCVTSSIGALCHHGLVARGTVFGTWQLGGQRLRVGSHRGARHPLWSLQGRKHCGGSLYVCERKRDYPWTYRCRGCARLHNSEESRLGRRRPALVRT